MRVGSRREHVIIIITLYTVAYQLILVGPCSYLQIQDILEYILKIKICQC